MTMATCFKAVLLYF